MDFLFVYQLYFLHVSILSTWLSAANLDERGVGLVYWIRILLMIGGVLTY